MKLEDIETNWGQDSKINSADLATESLRVPELHHKYFKIFTQERLLLKKFEQDYKQLYKLKYEYYMGIMDEGELRANGWEPFALKVLKTDLQIFMDGDQDLCNVINKIEFQKEKIALLDSIIKTVVNRGFLIKNAIDFLRFTNGT